MALLCGVCGVRVPPHERNCPGCQGDVGFPNVRAAETTEEVAALNQRVRLATEDAESRNCLSVLQEFASAVLSSKAVFCRSLSLLNSLVSSETALYNTFHQQVQAQARIPEENFWDTARPAVGSTLFPHYYEKIGFALLSLDNQGSTRYGRYTIVLKDAMIANRSSVFEENPILFFQKRTDIKVGDTLVPGYRAIWAQRNKLAMAKCHTRVTQATPTADFPSILFKRGSTPAQDDFIEVHFYGPIHRSAIEKVIGPQPRRHERAMFKDLQRKLREVGASLETL